MNGCGQRPQTENETWRWSVEEFVSNAVNPVLFCSAHLLPAPIANDFFQRNPIAGPAPGRNNHIGILRENGFSRCLFSRRTYEFSAGCRDQFGHPRLRRDQGLAPFFTEYARTLGAISSAANGLDFPLHLLDHFLSAIECAHDSC